MSKWSRRAKSEDVTSTLTYRVLVLFFWPVIKTALALLALAEMLVYFGLGRHMRSRGKQLRTDLTGEQPIATFELSDANLDWKALRRDFIDRGIPFILRDAGHPLSKLAPAEEEVAKANKEGCIRVMTAAWFGALPGLDEIIAKLFPGSPRAYWPFWFLGQYAQGKAHIDLGPHTVNCYYLRKGVKDVVIVPPEVTRNVPIQTGLDGCFVDEKLAGPSEDESRPYLAALPYYHRVDLQPHSLLVFNNATCIHQFRNVRDPIDGSWPEALSTRMKLCATAEPRLWGHMICNLMMCKRFAGVLAMNLMRPAFVEDRRADYL